jgi:DNA invertase Pin-like site-specific DNA recombinase
VKASLRNARAKGKRLGKPCRGVDPPENKRLRAEGASWHAVGRKSGVSAATALRALRKGRLENSAAPGTGKPKGRETNAQIGNVG